MFFRVSPLASVALLGWVIATSQTTLLREALAASQGNELAIALALGQWLVLTAAGSAAAGLLPSRLSRWFLVAGALLLGPALFAALLTARGLPRIFSLAPGALLTLDQHVLGLLLTLAPVCLVGGASFTLACRLPGVAPARAYLAEAAGWLAGGVTATWLVETWQPFAVAAGLSIGVVLAAALLLGRVWMLAVVGLAVVAVLGQRGLGAIEARSLAWRWPGETIEASAYTRHGHVAVLRRAGQRVLYEDGHLALVLPEPQSSEELAHLALLQVSEPRWIFVARGLGGLLPEILKYPVVEVALAEPEVSLAEIEIKAADLATRQALSDPRVHRLTGDVRNLLRRGAGNWDVVILEHRRAVDPARQSSAHQGKLCRGPACVAARRRAGLCPAWCRELLQSGTGRAQRCGVQGAGLRVRARHGDAAVDQLLFGQRFASEQRSRGAGRRLDRRKVTATFVDEYSLAVLMPEERLQSLSNRYRGVAVAASSDRLPTAYLHNLLVSGRADPGRVAALLRRALGLGFWPLELGLAVLLVLLAVLAARGRKAHVPVLLVVSVVGFASMASAVLILAVTQSALGVLHHLLGALLAANMAGLALVAWGAGEFPKIRLWGALCLGLVVPVLLPLLSRISTQAPAGVMMAVLLVASLVAGAAVGIAFRTALVAGATPAAIYVVDLLGAALAAPVIAAIALPGFGLDAACVLVALLAVPPVLAIAIARQR